MGKYAADKAVLVSKSRNEIERTLARFGATAFASFSNSAGQKAFEVPAMWMGGVGMSDQSIDRHQDGAMLVVRNYGRWGLWGNTAKAGEPDNWEYWEISVPDAGQTAEEALAELLSESQPRMHDPLCLYCGMPLSVGCECLKGPVQDPDPCPAHGPLQGMMLWDGEDQYGRPVGGWRSFCIQCEEARNAAGVW